MVAHRAVVKGPRFARAPPVPQGPGAGPREGPGIWPLIAGVVDVDPRRVAAVGAIAGSVPDRL